MNMLTLPCKLHNKLNDYSSKLLESAVAELSRLPGIGKNCIKTCPAYT